MLAVGLIAFALFRFVGDPVTFMLGQDATDQDRARVTKLLGLDRPFYVQYAAFVERALQGAVLAEAPVQDDEGAREASLEQVLDATLGGVERMRVDAARAQRIQHQRA